MLPEAEPIRYCDLNAKSRHALGGPQWLSAQALERAESFLFGRSTNMNAVSEASHHVST
jgi:hypothetical protein